MSSARDVDDTILSQAMSLLPYVGANGHPHIAVRNLSDVPWLLVLVFELLTTETLPEEMKPFDSLEDQAHTLQMILDTLEQTLRLPMNHITGRGLARLERRPLSDVLQIFADLVKHCYPTTRDRGASAQETPEGRRLSLSQFGSPEFGEVNFSQFSTPEKSTISRDGIKCPPDKQLETESMRQNVCDPSPVMTVRPVPQTHQAQFFVHARKNATNQHTAEREENKIDKCIKNSARPAEKDNSLQSSKSSITLLKEVYRQREATDWPIRDGVDIELEGDHVNKHTRNKSPQKHQLFAPRLPRMSLLSPTASAQKNRPLHNFSKNNRDANGRGPIISPIEVKSHRYTPYEQPSTPHDLIEYPLTKRVMDQSRNRMTSAKSSNTAKKPDDRIFRQAPSVQRLCRKPSVKSFRSPKVSTSRCTAQGKSSAHSMSHMKTVNNRTSHVIEHEGPHRRQSRPCTSVRSAKELDIISDRTRKASVLKSKPNPSVTGIVKKPPTHQARNPSNKGKVVSTGRKNSQRYGTGSVSCRRQVDELQFSSYDASPSDISEKKCGISPMPHEHSFNHRRKPSVVSTKVRKHSLASPNSPEHTPGRNPRFSRPVKRGDVSPQTTSLCSSLKLLEEFDYVKRRLRQIQIQKREYREAIRELEREEVRLEYLLTHVQQQTTRALNKGPLERTVNRGRPV